MDMTDKQRRARAVYAAAVTEMMISASWHFSPEHDAWVSAQGVMMNRADVAGYIYVAGMTPQPDAIVLGGDAMV